jgi:8-oxo-dGTP pyrophosphatase MutT (NUDIX family)
MGKVIAAGVLSEQKKWSFDLSSDKPFNESLGIPKGKVEVGETMINAAIRETYETILI